MEEEAREKRGRGREGGEMTQRKKSREERERVGEDLNEDRV